MTRGIRPAKDKRQKKAGNAKEVGKTVAQILGIGLVAGTALIIATDRIMKKVLKAEEPEDDLDGDFEEIFDDEFDEE